MSKQLECVGIQTN